MTLHPARADARNAHADLDQRGSSGSGTEAALASVEDRATRRRARAESLAEDADGDPRQLEDLRSDSLRRLHRTSADLEATEGLRTVELALSMTPCPERLLAPQRRERDQKRRWWSRRKRATA
jgi:hypothetical protein